MDMYASRERVNSLDRVSSVDGESNRSSLERQSSFEEDGSDQGGFNVSSFWVQWKNPERVRRARVSLDQNQNEASSKSSASSDSRYSEPHEWSRQRFSGAESKRLSAPDLRQKSETSQAETVKQVTSRLYQVKHTHAFNELLTVVILIRTQGCVKAKESVMS